MTARFHILWPLCMAVVFQLPLVAQNASPNSFVGTWVGLQSWASENPSPSAKEEQPVELTIQLVDGKLAGFMNPFFGGSDGASFVDVKIVGDQLQASAVMGKPASGESGRQPKNWKSSVVILFNFKTETNNKLRGTADISLGDVKWLKFGYDLSRKRSLY